MAVTSDIIQSLKGKTKTLGWDAVVAYDRDKINRLFQQQYISKLAAGTHFKPFSWSNQLGTIQFENITLSAPRLSFVNASTQNSRVVATLSFLDGSVIERNTDGQVTSYMRIRPGMGYGLTLNVDLLAGQGSVDEQGKVQIDFSQGTVTLIDIINNPPAEVLAFFEQWLASNTVIYELGQLSLKDLGTGLTPKKFVIRTQQAPRSARRQAEDDGYGAVLLFVATNVNPSGGLLPTDTYPWLIPQEFSSTILVSNRILIERYLKPELDKMLTSGHWELVRGLNDDDAFSLRVSENATLNAGRVRTRPLGSISGHDVDYTWSGDYNLSPGYKEIPEDFIYSLRGATLSLNAETLAVNFDSGNTFRQDMGARFAHHGGGITGDYWDRATLKFTLTGGAVFAFTLDHKTESVGIVLRDNSVSMNSDFVKEWGFLAQGKSVAEAIHAELQLLLVPIIRNFLEDLKFTDIEVFALNHVLFPEHNINRLQSAYIPGDMAIFGEIEPSLTSLVLEPMQTVLSVGQSLQFTTSAGAGVTYSLSPANSGTLSASGLYRAPATINGGILNVTVTARTANASAAAHISVVATPVLVSPVFIALQESNPRTIQLDTTVLGEGNTLATWHLASSAPGITGMITQDGLYMPPDEAYPLGYTYVTATATATDGKTSSVYILLISHQTNAEFKIAPPFVTDLSPGAVQTLSAEASLDFDPNEWTCFPQLGTLGQPVQEGNAYRVEYTAPATVKGDELVIVRAIQKNKTHRAGYAVIDVANKKQTLWPQIEGVSILKVVNESGGGSTQVYKNSAQQAVIIVQFSGYRMINGIPEKVNVSLEDILPHIELVDHTTGKALSRDAGEDWYYSIKENEFERLPTGDSLTVDSSDNQNADNYTLYISCNTASKSTGIRVAVQVTLADGRIISTASNGTSGFNSHVYSAVLPAIDYSLATNVETLQDSPTVILNELTWESRRAKGIEIEKRDDFCKLSVRNIIITPADPNIDKFHSFEFYQHNVSNSDVSTNFINWNGTVEQVYSCLDKTFGQQCSVLGKSEKAFMDGTTNIWFTGSVAKLKEGGVYFSSKSDDKYEENSEDYTYRISVPAFEHGQEKNTNPQLMLVKISTPESEMPKIETIKPYQWKSVLEKVTLFMTDIYGNTGKLTLIWDENEHYDTPSIL